MRTWQGWAEGLAVLALLAAVYVGGVALAWVAVKLVLPG
jgi:hypothetical protein